MDLIATLSSKVELKWEQVPIRVRKGRDIRPGGKWGHTVNAVGDGRIFVIGGYSSDEGDIPESKGSHSTNEVSIFDITSSTWSKSRLRGAPPSPRDSHSCTLVGANLFVFGGTNGVETFNDLYILDTVTQLWWTPHMCGDIPPSREGHGAALIHSSLFIFGGTGMFLEDGEQKEKCLNDLYVLDTRSFHWTKVETSGTSPAPRNGPTCIAYREMLVVLGGVDDCGLISSYCEDVKVLDTQTMLWEDLLTIGDWPVPRAGHVTMTLGEYLLVVGGFTDAQVPTDDVYVLDLESGIWKKASPSGEGPSPRFAGAGACFDPERGLFVLIGGCNKELEPLNDLFFLSLHTSPSLPLENMEENYPIAAEPVVGNDPEEGSSTSSLQGLYTRDPGMDDSFHHFPRDNTPTALANSATLSQPESHDPDTTAADSDTGMAFEAKITKTFHYGYQVKVTINGESLRGLVFTENPSHFNAVHNRLIKKKVQQRRKRRATTNLPGKSRTKERRRHDTC